VLTPEEAESSDCLETVQIAIGVLEGIRTPDPRFRKPVLYPAELPRRVAVFLNVFCVWVKLDLVGLGRIS
jgi:hypothetical protein